MEQTPLYSPERYRTLEGFDLSDLEVVRLILQGGSVLDWHSLNLTQEEAESFCRVHRIDPNHPEDTLLINRIRDESVAYLRETFDFPIPRPVRNASFYELIEMAGDDCSRHRRLCACTLLKAMHIINHFDAREACQALVMTDQELFNAAERRIYRTVSHMMADGLPVVEFSGGRKRRASMVTKLLSKPSPLSAQLFDKMRFRVITTKSEDVLPVINFLSRSLFPFNYVLAGESYNTLQPFSVFCDQHENLANLAGHLQFEIKNEGADRFAHNTHSSPGYRVVHWIADMPLRIPNYHEAFVTDGVNPIPRPVVYVRVEIQILDRRSHRANEQGDASHDLYKRRQIETVATRLKVGFSPPRS